MITLTEGEGRRRAFFDVSNDLLAELLKLPEGTQIIRVTDAACLGPMFQVVIEHPEFKTVEIGHQLPRVSPLYESYYGENGEWIDYQFKEW